MDCDLSMMIEGVCLDKWWIFTTWTCGKKQWVSFLQHEVLGRLVPGWQSRFSSFLSAYGSLVQEATTSPPAFSPSLHKLETIREVDFIVNRPPPFFCFFGEWIWGDIKKGRARKGKQGQCRVFLGRFPWHQDFVPKLDQKGGASLIWSLSGDIVLGGMGRWEEDML